MRDLVLKLAKAARTPFLALGLWAGVSGVALAFSNGGMTPELAQAMSRSPEQFSAMLCPRLRYLEAKVLAAARICPGNEHSRRSFANAPSCISSDEGVLPQPARDYLKLLRQTIDAKGCEPW